MGGGGRTSGYFAASYFFHICIKEGCALFFFAGGWLAALSASGTRLATRFTNFHIFFPGEGFFDVGGSVGWGLPGAQMGPQAMAWP